MHGEAVTHGSQNRLRGPTRPAVAQFAHAVELGLGRAVLALQDGDSAPYRDALLRACLHDFTFDGQVESREQPQYVFELVHLASDVAWYRARILAGLGTTADLDDLAYLFELARLFAEEGNGEARAAMYAQFAGRAAAAAADLGAPETGADQIVRLDGVRGLIFVAEHVGGRLGTDGGWYRSWLMDLARDKDGADAVDREVAAARGRSTHVAAYFEEMDRVSNYRAEPDQEDITRLSYDALRERIEADATKLLWSSLGRWGKLADDESVQRAARDLSRQTEPSRIMAYAWIFAKRPFPLDPAPLIAAARSDDEKLARAALNALEHLDNPAVRQLALELLPNPDRASMAVDLLARNYVVGDHALIERALAAAQDENERHWLGYGALAVFEANPSAEATAALTMLYETGPCARCRERCFDLLHRIGTLPDWMLRESAYDANFDLREKARGLAADEQPPLGR